MCTYISAITLRVQAQFSHVFRQFALPLVCLIIDTFTKEYLT